MTEEDSPVPALSHLLVIIAIFLHCCGERAA